MTAIDPLSILAKPAPRNRQRKIPAAWRLMNFLTGGMEQVSAALRNEYGDDLQAVMLAGAADEEPGTGDIDAGGETWLLSVDCLCSAGELSAVFSKRLVEAFAGDHASTNEMITSFLYSLLRLFSKDPMNSLYPGKVLSVRRIARLSESMHPGCFELPFAVCRKDSIHRGSILMSRSLVARLMTRVRSMAPPPRGLRLERIPFINAGFFLGWGFANLFEVSRLKTGQRFDLSTATRGGLRCTAAAKDRTLYFEGAAFVEAAPPRSRIHFSIHSFL